MHHRYATMIVLATLCLISSARADVIISLTAQDQDGNPITGDVAPGTELTVDILLATAPGDGPLPDIRGIAFDFTQSNAGLELSDFVWRLEPGTSDASYFSSPTLPTPSTSYIQSERREGLILDLTETPVRVASITVVVTAGGSLDLGASTESGGASLRADFADPVDFTFADGNLSGGSLLIATTTATDPDRDGDGVPDDEDAFPDDPDETTDTDGDGIGNNLDINDDGDSALDIVDAFPLDPSETVDTDGDGVGDNADAFPTDPDRSSAGHSTNTGPRATGGMCGAGIITPALALFSILCGMHLSRRGRRSHSG